MSTQKILTPEQATALYKNLGKMTAAEKVEALELLERQDYLHELQRRLGLGRRRRADDAVHGEKGTHPRIVHEFEEQLLDMPFEIMLIQIVNLPQKYLC